MLLFIYFSGINNNYSLNPHTKFLHIPLNHWSVKGTIATLLLCFSHKSCVYIKPDWVRLHAQWWSFHIAQPNFYHFSINLAIELNWKPYTTVTLSSWVFFRERSLSRFKGQFSTSKRFKVTLEVFPPTGFPLRDKKLDIYHFIRPSESLSSWDITSHAMHPR